MSSMIKYPSNISVILAGKQYCINVLCIPKFTYHLHGKSRPNFLVFHSSLDFSHPPSAGEGVKGRTSGRGASAFLTGPSGTSELGF